MNEAVDLWRNARHHGGQTKYFCFKWKLKSTQRARRPRARATNHQHQGQSAEARKVCAGADSTYPSCETLYPIYDRRCSSPPSPHAIRSGKTKARPVGKEPEFNRQPYSASLAPCLYNVKGKTRPKVAAADPCLDGLGAVDICYLRKLSTLANGMVKASAANDF
jgi:hypothetical protein